MTLSLVTSVGFPCDEDRNEMQAEFTFSMEIFEDDMGAREYVVRCSHEHDAGNGEVTTQSVGSLRGFAYLPGYVPGIRGFGRDFDVFDSRSQHASDAFEILQSEPEEIIAKIPQCELRGLKGVVFCENGNILPSFRGNRLMLALLSQVKHRTEFSNALMIMKAHPEGEETNDEMCLRLAEYYMSEPSLRLIPIEPIKYPGWIMAIT